jgi:SAM-dependent methyltransferase
VTHREKASSAPAAPVLAHDHEKKKILQLEGAAPFLKAVGIMAQDGKIKADMQRKFRQINEFLRVLDETGSFEAFAGQAVRVVDFGCGNAYLTFATFDYLNRIMGLEAYVTGVDIKADLLESHRRKASALGWERLTFAEGRIGEYQPDPPPDVVIALHACDTATDDALAQGIRAGSRLIVTAPCCQHDLQEQLSKVAMPPPMLAVSRDGILNERLGDVLTDTFRATLLRILGYRTDVIQFVSTEHTAKNLLIRSVKTSGGPLPNALEEYRALKTFWGVTPYLEHLLADQVSL